MRRRAKAFFAVLACMASALSHGPALAQQDDATFRRESRRALAALAEAFARDNLFPIAMPEGQKPGDAYTYTNFWLPESRADDCFAGLAPVVSPWPSVERTGLSEASADGRLSLLRLLHLSGASQATASVSLSFTDVQSQTVTRQDLLRGLRRADCPYLVAALEAQVVPVSSWSGVRQQLNERPVIVLHRVVEARRRIVISLLDAAEGGVRIDNPQELVRALGLEGDPRARFIDGELAAKANATRQRAIVIEDAGRVPVAFTPVALPNVRSTPLLSGSAEGRPQAVEWIAVDAGGDGIGPLLREWREDLAVSPN